MTSDEPIRGQSVADIAYARIRGQIIDGALAPSSRLNQGDLASKYGISRTSMREALHRLTAETLVEFRRHRGFFVAEPLPLQAVLHRLEVRLLLEPEIARLATERATARQVLDLNAAVDMEANASTPLEAHDVSRSFHMKLAEAAANEELVRVLGTLWGVDVGRQLLAERGKMPGWQIEDVSEHRAIAEAVATGDAALSARLMEEHLSSARTHWSRQAEVRESVATPEQELLLATE